MQEEPINAGCYTFVRPHLERITRQAGIANPEIEYIGRKSLTCSAHGIPKRHSEESAQLMEAVKGFAKK